jgi:hypothetical protein
LLRHEIQISNLKVGEELAVVVIATVVGIQQPVKVGFWMYQLWVGVDE